MKLFTLRSLAMVAVCLSASLLVAGKNDEKKHHDSRKKIEVTTTKDSGKGSLRCAIEKANRLNCENGVHIVFKLEKKDCGYNCKTGTWVIKPKTELPEVTAPEVWLDFSSQCGYEPNTNSFCKPSNAKLVIELDGSCIRESASKARAQASASAAILPVALLRFRESAFGARLTAPVLHSSEIGVQTFAPSTVVEGAVASSNPAITLPKPNRLSDFVFEAPAINSRLGGLSRSSRWSAAANGGLIDEASTAAVSGVYGAVTIRTTGFSGLTGTINIAGGNTQLNPVALRGFVVDRSIPGNVDDAAAVSGVTFDFQKIASAGHLIAEGSLINHTSGSISNYSLGTNLQRTAAIRPIANPSGVNAAAVSPFGDGLVVDHLFPIGLEARLNLTNGHISGVRTAARFGLNSHPAAVIHTTTNAHQVGTVAPNTNGLDHAVQGDFLLERSNLTRNLGFGARFADLQLDNASTKSNAALIGAIRLLGNRFTDNLDSGFIITTARPSSSNANSVTGTAQTTGVAVGRKATYLSGLDDSVINNKVYNHTFGIAA